ncbi:hypothetical protein VitviT2T_002668 [Vitis vinifera]|uniref:MADS-box domain-containing protein n=1 Tax=Vitis vinifera TaxID=29760 RepID=A0ABY9BJ82_VITVI|nr:hypothetical protein VitviT2T_002668 [Vitis vinifera]
MARKKVKLQWIVDIVARKATYKKKVKGLMKNVRDLSILSGVDASRLENDQTKKVMNQENFTWQRIFKARDEVVKQQMKNRKKEIENLRIQ